MDAGSECSQVPNGALPLLGMLELPYECAEPRPKLLGEVELRVLVVRLGELLDSRGRVPQSSRCTAEG